MRYLTVSQAAERLQLSVPTVKRYIYDGRLSSTKLPGGQHRIPESEIRRLLSPEGPEAHTAPPTAPDATTDERLAVVERWVTELEAEVERLSAGLAVVSRYCSLVTESEEEQHMAESTPGARVQVLGPGCRRCDALHELVVRVLRDLDRTDVAVEHVTELNRIVVFGPVVTPALVIDGELVLSGRVPDESDLRELLGGHLG